MGDTPQGVYDVHFGASFFSGDAESNRPGSSKDSSGYHILRYASKPASLESSTPAVLSMTKGRGRSPGSLIATFPASNSSSGCTSHDGDKSFGRSSNAPVEHRFTGTISAAREVDCVLIWNEDIQSYVLERLDSCIRFTHDRTAPPPRNGTPTPNTSRAPVSRPGTPSLRSDDVQMDKASSTSSSDSESLASTVAAARSKTTEEHHRTPLTVGSNGLEKGASHSFTPTSKQEDDGMDVEDFGNVSLARSSSKPRASVPSVHRETTPAHTLARRATPVQSKSPPKKPEPPLPPASSKPIPSTGRGLGGKGKVAANKRLAGPPAVSSGGRAPRRGSGIGRRRASTTAHALGLQPFQPAIAFTGSIAPFSSGSESDDDEDDEDEEDEDEDEDEDEEEADSGTPEGYLAVPGSVLSRSASQQGISNGSSFPLSDDLSKSLRNEMHQNRVGAISRKTIPVSLAHQTGVAASASASASAISSMEGSGQSDESEENDQEDVESDDMDLFASSINASLANVGPGNPSSTRSTAAGQSGQGTAAYAQQDPLRRQVAASKGLPLPSMASKRPYSSTLGATSQQKQAELENDIPDSSEED